MRGVVRDSVSGDPVEGALVTLLDSAAQMVSVVRSGRGGDFMLRGTGTGHYAIDVRRIGYRRHTSAWIPAATTDTLEVTVRLARLPVMLAAVEIEGEREALINTVDLFGLNVRSLPPQNVITPSQVEASRGAARDYVDLMQAQHLLGYQVREYDTLNGRRCYASTRPPYACLQVVVDGLRVGREAAIELARPGLVEFAIVIPGDLSGSMHGGPAGVLYIGTWAGTASRARRR